MNFLVANPGGAMMQGMSNAYNVIDQRRENDRKNALADLYKAQGAGIASGDQNALNALAAIDPMTARGINRENKADARADEQWQMQVQKHAASMSAAEREATAAKLKKGIFAASAATSEAEWDALANQFGVPDLVGQFGQKDALLRQYMTAAQIMEAGQPEKPTSAMKEYELAKSQGFQGSFMDYQTAKSRAGPTNITLNTGDTGPQIPLTDKPPKGFQRVYDQENNTWRDEPIPGSNPDEDRTKAAEKVKLATADYDRKFQIVDSNIKKAISMLEENGRWVAGYGSLLSGLPESGARDFQAVLDTVKANLGFEELQAMRDNSPTGGALGQVTEREIAFLQAIQGNLDAAQSPEQLLSILKEIQARRSEFAAERRSILGRVSNSTGNVTVDPETLEFMTPDERALFE